MEFARPDNIIVTNLSSVDLNDECLIYHHHQRGADELPHRGLKEFGSEQKHKRNKRVRVSIGAPWKRRSMLAMSQLGHYVNRRNVQAAVSQVWPIFFGGRRK